MKIELSLPETVALFMTKEELKKLIYRDVKADIETEADAESPFQEGYSVGFNDCRWRILVALLGRSVSSLASPPFIAALKTGGTKEEAIFALERMWEENCALRAEIEKLRGVPQEQLACDCGAPTEGEWADKHTAGCALRAEIDRLRNFSDKAMKEWQHALCREGKMIGRITSPISQSDSDS